MAPAHIIDDEYPWPPPKSGLIASSHGFFYRWAQRVWFWLSALVLLRLDPEE